MTSAGQIRVMIVDDSALVRTILTRILADKPDITVVAAASDPVEARPLILQHNPTVIILDLEMPRMDGLTFLALLRRYHPIPVIVCSGAAPADSQNALDAVALGAIDVVCKPSDGRRETLAALGESLAEKIRAAARSMPVVLSNPEHEAGLVSFAPTGLDPRLFVIAIGASTGGTEALKVMISRISDDFPPIVIVQHMPEAFTAPFAQRLNQYSRAAVSEAVDGDMLVPGRVFVARGGTQMRIAGRPGFSRIAYGSHEPLNRHCPSVDVLFDSVAHFAGEHAAGIILTGMGSDGAAGLLRMRQAGALTISQNMESCAVYGMPKVAVEMGAVERTGTPADIPSILVQALHRRAAKLPTPV